MNKPLHFIILLLLNFSMCFGQRIIYEDFNYPYQTKLTDIGWIAHAEKGINPINLTDYNSSTPLGRYATIRNESGESIHTNIKVIRKGRIYFKRRKCIGSYSKSYNKRRIKINSR